jgi:hypothetical protein
MCHCLHANAADETITVYMHMKIAEFFVSFLAKILNFVF